MKDFLKLNLLYGFLIWLIPFALSFVLFPLRQSDRIFFESILAVSLVAVTVWFAISARAKGILKSWQTGILWVLISILLDQAFFTWGPQKMIFVEYWKNIGFGYLVIPMITLATYQKPIPVLSGEKETAVTEIEDMKTSGSGGDQFGA